MGLLGYREKNHDVIHVQFYDQATGKLFAESHVPIGQLPASFEARTTLHLGDADWSVCEARPITAAEFRCSGKLVLILNKITKAFVDPATILYSLPTITNDALPPIVPGSSKLGANVIEIHEDDWRQIEWISSSFAKTIETELDAIRRIHAEERLQYGFRKLHLRCAIPTPLVDRNLSVETLQAALGPKALWFAGMAYRGTAGVVDRSFAVRLMSSIQLFGVVADGSVQALCFANVQSNNVPMPDAHNLAQIAEEHNLILVDWCQAAAIEASDQAYLAYFDRGND